MKNPFRTFKPRITQGVIKRYDRNFLFAIVIIIKNQLVFFYLAFFNINQNQLLFPKYNPL